MCGALPPRLPVGANALTAPPLQNGHPLPFCEQCVSPVLAVKAHEPPGVLGPGSGHPWNLVRGAGKALSLEGESKTVNLNVVTAKFISDNVER